MKEPRERSMAAQQAARIRDENEPVEEIYYRKGDIDFCFLLNRRHHNLRVFDYRVGNYQQKRDFFDRIARAEGLRKVFTVVEKQDSKSWRSVGFSREGAIPGYFRTADAYIMSRVYTEDGDPIQGGAPKLHGPSVTLRDLTPAKPRGMSVEVATDQNLPQGGRTGAVDGGSVRAVPQGDVPPRRRPAREDRQAASTGWARRPTARSATRRWTSSLRRRRSQASPPRRLLHAARCSRSCARWTPPACSAWSAVDDAMANQVYADLGFKVTARLTDHVSRGDDFVGVQLWHRRLSTQSAPRLPSFI